MNCIKTALAAALVSTLVLASGCSQNELPQAQIAPAPTGATAAPVDPTFSSQPSPAEPSTPNDLAVSHFRRTFNSAGLKLTVEYAATPSVDRWTPTGAKSVRMTMTAVNNKKPGRKVYLTRASVRIGLRDATGEIPGPGEPVVDIANIEPGYLVTTPYSYNQSFAIPPLDSTANAVILEFKFETVTLVGQKAKDYTKQSSTDTVRVAVSF